MVDGVSKRYYEILAEHSPINVVDFRSGKPVVRCATGMIKKKIYGWGMLNYVFTHSEVAYCGYDETNQEIDGGY